ncbi:MAG: 5-oxoprolinase subunit PxpB [Sediminibacterium sp.]
MCIPSYHIYPCGDHAVTIELGNEVAVAVNQKVLALFYYLSENTPDGVTDIIPAYNTLTLVYDVVFLKKSHPAIFVYEHVCAQLQKAVVAIGEEMITVARRVKIPVCYDASLAPDLFSLAESNKLSIEQVIQLHTGKIYRVYMIGFLPGFAYMGSVDEKIITPRLTQPRVLVPAGSIGIAGEQTGIYPFDSPGGWQLIGQTPVQMFDAKKELPCYLQPGDEVQFYAISLGEFTKQKKA